MGGGSSKTVSKIITDSLIKISSSYESQISQSGTGLMNIENSTIGQGAVIIQELEIKQKALAMALADTNLSSQVMDQAKQVAAAESSALGVALTNNENEVKKAFETAISSKSQSIISQLGSLTLNIKNSTVGPGASVKQASFIIQDVIFKSLNNNKNFSDVATKVDLQAQNSFSLLNVFGPYTWIILLVVAAAAGWYFLGMPGIGKGAGTRTESSVGSMPRGAAVGAV